MLEQLAAKELNGRQIKNVVRIAQALAVKEGQGMKKRHVDQALDAMISFDKEFENCLAESGRFPDELDYPGPASAKRRRIGS
jgi:hypothetical protein